MHVIQVGVVHVMDWLTQHLLSPFLPSFTLQIGSVFISTGRNVRNYIFVSWPCFQWLCNGTTLSESGGSSLVSGPAFVAVTVQYPTKDERSLGKGLGVQLTDQTSITCTLKIGPLYPGKKNMKKWEKVLLLITAIPTAGVSISVIICCKCLASQLVIGNKPRGCVLVHLQYAYREPTHSHLYCDHNVTLWVNYSTRVKKQIQQLTMMAHYLTMCCLTSC